MTTATLAVPKPLTPEDEGRAEMYALLAQLFRTAPDQPLLDAIAALEVDAVGAFADALRALAQAARLVPRETVGQEFAELFEGASRAEVFTNASWYLAGFLHEQPLSDLRNHLAELGLTRSDAAQDTEDHITAICEVMHYLIARHHGPLTDRLAAQKRWFVRWIQPWFTQFFESLAKHPNANFYRVVARFGIAFTNVESEHVQYL